MKKNIVKRLNKLNYSLCSDIFGWIVVNNETGSEQRFSTLGSILRFIVSAENTIPQ